MQYAYYTYCTTRYLQTEDLEPAIGGSRRREEAEQRGRHKVALEVHQGQFGCSFELLNSVRKKNSFESCLPLELAY